MSTPCFVHKTYLEMYFDPLMVPAGAVEYVNGIRNCEDILLSIVITKFLQDSNRPQSGVLAVKSSLSVKNLETPSGMLCIIIGFTGRDNFLNKSLAAVAYQL